jgi:hypothetical protein
VRLYKRNSVQFHAGGLIANQRKELIMKSHFQPRRSGSGAQGPMGSAVPYMSESQTRAYLMARDTIRRIQQSSQMGGSMAPFPTDAKRMPVGRHHGH